MLCIVLAAACVIAGFIHNGTALFDGWSLLAMLFAFAAMAFGWFADVRISRR